MKILQAISRIQPRTGAVWLALAASIALTALLSYDLYRDREAKIDAAGATSQNLARLLVTAIHRMSSSRAAATAGV